MVWNVRLLVRQSLFHNHWIRISFNKQIWRLSNIIDAMNNITLEDGEEGGVAIDMGEVNENDHMFVGFSQAIRGGSIHNWWTCRILDTIANVSSLVETWKGCIYKGTRDQPIPLPILSQQTLAILWKLGKGKGVYIKDLETNLYLFQFYHELDMNDSPWLFNRLVWKERTQEALIWTRWTCGFKYTISSQVLCRRKLISVGLAKQILTPH